MRRLVDLLLAIVGVIVVAALCSGCAVRWDDSANSGRKGEVSLLNPFNRCAQSKTCPVGGNANGEPNTTTIGGTASPR